ncbi:MAG: electron transfer flavoprotein subunit alpha/FixB family protein [Chloroflexota bacterium]
MIFGFIDHDRGKLNEQSLEMLTLAQRLAADLGDEVEAIVIGESGREIASSLGAYGVTKIHLVVHEQLDDFAPSAWARSIGQLMKSESPAAVLAPGSERGNEILAHLAAQNNLPMAANCTEIQPSQDGYQVTRVRWGGSLLEEALLKGATKLLSIAPLAVVPTEADSPAELTINEVTPTIADKDLRVRVTSRVQPEADKVSLTDANVVVGGGRGVGSTEGFETLDELAGLLGGAVGCSRAVTNEGWRPHADQVGQTGARVSPELYIAAGISGAIQHYAGCKGAKQILVINTDPEAPIISKADYAVIGDLHQVLPAITDEVRKLQDS